MYKPSRPTKSLYILVAMAMILSTLPFSPQVARATEVSPETFTQVNDVVATPLSLQRDNGIAVLKAAALADDGSTLTESVYIIQLLEQSVALYDGTIPGLSATSRRATGAAKVDMQSASSVAYAAHLAQRRQVFKSKLGEVLGRSPEVVHEYFSTLNGLAVRLNSQEALKVAALPNVRYIEEEQMHYPQTFSGPEWMGANAIWAGDDKSGIEGTKGEGIIVGIIDSGINATNPSFADIGGDGYDHTNPFGAGNYVGVCNPADPSYNPSIPCNDKLIGIWGHPDVDGGNPLDTDGHGSHTAGTAAGNVVSMEEAVVNAPNGFSVAKTISGVAPHANIIAYDGCIDGSGCPGSALAAARDQALIDGVDVINYSIGSGASPNPWDNAEAIQWLALRSAGIFVATSAGNSGNGPETVGSPAIAPWITSVGASTHDVPYANQLVDLSGGDTPPPAAMTGRAISIGYGPAPIVYAGDYGDAICAEPFAPGTFNGEIVICDRGEVARVAKGENIKAGGAGGLIHAQVTPGGFGGLAADPHFLPAIHITQTDADALKAWLATGSGHMGRITETSLESNPAFGDIMAEFSSRGPNPSVSDIIKPNMTAPGSSIMAAYAVGVEFNTISGTSMSSPHIAGAGALLKAVHPDWTPAEIESALMSTAKTAILDDDGVTQASYFAMGAGRPELQQAVRAALVLDETEAGYLAANPEEGGDPSQINTASMGEGDCITICGWIRTVSNVSDRSMTWTAAVTADDGVAVSVSPESFTLEPGATQDISVELNLAGTPTGEWRFGALTLTPNFGRVPATVMPIAARSSGGKLPASVDVVTRRDAGSYLATDLQSIEITELTATSSGLTKGEVQIEALVSDPTNGNPYDGFSDPLTDGAFYVVVDIPAGTASLIANIPASESGDIDLFVGSGATPSAATELCASTTASFTESCELVAPEAGQYWILVQNWDDSNGPDLPGELTALRTAVVPAADQGNLRVEGPTSVDRGQEFDLRIFWDEEAMEAGDIWYGYISLGSDPANPGNIGTIPVTVERVADDVTKTADPETAAVGDTVTYTIQIEANVTDQDIAYMLTDTIPDGMSYVPGSATGGATVAGNVLTWEGIMPVPETEYTMSTSDTDPLCDTPFGGYVNLEEFGVLTSPSIAGDLVAFTVNWDGGVPIEFYGENKGPATSFTDDGYATFGDSLGSTPWINTPLPFSDAPNDLMAAFWKDMEIVYDAATNRGVSLATAAGGALSVIEFDDMVAYPAPVSAYPPPVTDGFDFEILQWHVTDDSPGAYEIFFAYDNLNGDLNPVTIGIENATGTSGQQYIYNDATPELLHDGLIVCFDQVKTGTATVVTYQATIDSAPASGVFTNSVVHDTDDPGSKPAIASADVMIAAPLGGITITESDGMTTVEEGSGEVDSYTIVLDSEPSAPVVIRFEHDGGQIHISNLEIGFDKNTWNVPRTITILGKADGVLEGDHQTVIQHSVDSADPSYPANVPFTTNGPTAGTDPSMVLVKITDGDAAPPDKPTAVPTEEPTAVPTQEPTAVPTQEPTAVPTQEPTAVPTQEPTAVPTEEPTAVPTQEPTAVPTQEPTAVPTQEPTAVPTQEPTQEPTAVPTQEPTAVPEPTAAPTQEPTAAPEPTVAPTAEPTAVPTAEPTVAPTADPTAAPTSDPTAAPTATPPGVPTSPPPPPQPTTAALNADGSATASNTQVGKVVEMDFTIFLPAINR